jgi:hypothetical protein
MTDEQINKAIEDHCGLWWTDEITLAILADVGPEGLAKVKEIDAVANNADLWINASSTSSAYSDVERLLKETFPFLSPRAILRVANAAAYGWK